MRGAQAADSLQWQTRRYAVDVSSALQDHQLSCADVRLTAIAWRVQRTPQQEQAAAGNNAGGTAPVHCQAVLGALAISAQAMQTPVLADLQVQPCGAPGTSQAQQAEAAHAVDAFVATWSIEGVMHC